MKRFSGGDEVEEILENGKSYQRKANVVWLLQVDEEFEVDTGRGSLYGEPGDYVGYDQQQHFLLVVAAAHLAERYEPIETGEDGHLHEWEPGVLPGDKRVRLCTVAECGAMEEINREEWDALRLQSAPSNRFAAPGRNG